MSETQRRIAIWGGRGYLGRALIEKLLADPNVVAIYDLDIANKQTEVEGGRVFHLHGSTLAPQEEITKFLRNNSIDTGVLLAWWFNPTHKVDDQWRVNIEGSKNVLRACYNSETVKYLFYAGSTTAYGQLDYPEEESLAEEDWLRNFSERLNAAYPYAGQKAHFDHFCQYFQKFLEEKRPDLKFGWMRGAIVAGRNTRNVVTDVAEAFGRFMFRPSGYNPRMQFISEYDMTNVLYRATMERWSGVVNVAGTGTLRFSDIIRILGKHEVVLPFWMLYAFCWLGWNIRIGDRSLLKFPPSILHLISKPWVAKIDKLIREFKFEPLRSSLEGIMQLREGLDNRRTKV